MSIKDELETLASANTVPSRVVCKLIHQRLHFHHLSATYQFINCYKHLIRSMECEFPFNVAHSSPTRLPTLHGEVEQRY